MEDICQICGHEREDCRTLRLQYLYDLSEVSDKLVVEQVTIRFADGHEATTMFFTIHTCKDCRGEFLGNLRRWIGGEFRQNAEGDDLDRNIPVHVDGRVVMMNTQEWQAHNAQRGEPSRTPHRLVQ